MTQVEGPNLLDYAENVVKVNTGPMNVDQQETNKATHYHQDASWGTS